MARQKQNDEARSNGSRPQLSGALATGVRDLPRNASWLVAKALTPLSAPREKVKDAGGEAVDKVRSTGAVVKDALPGTGDSVELRLKRAHAAADQAKDAEDQSVSSAREADRLAKEAERAEAEKEQRLEQTRAQQQAEADARGARGRAGGRTSRRRGACRCPGPRRQGGGARSPSRARGTRTASVGRPPRHSEQAEQDFARATERLAEARRLSDEATKAAQDAAAEAQREADRLNGAARTRKREAASSVTAARQAQKRTETAARKKVVRHDEQEGQRLGNGEARGAAQEGAAGAGRGAGRRRALEHDQGPAGARVALTRPPPPQRRSTTCSGRRAPGNVSPSRCRAPSASRRSSPAWPPSARHLAMTMASAAVSALRQTRGDPLMLGRLAVFGVGYVIGTRAGRERYETIRVAATALAARLEDYSRGDRGSAPTTRP